MKKLRHLVRINKDPGSDWGAIELHLRGMRADGARPPRPRQRAVLTRRTSREVDFYATVEAAA